MNLKPDPALRRHDLDWITVLATLAVFFFHCARFFNHEGWHVKNNTLSHGMSLFVIAVSQWLMPLLFLLSGMSACHSLKARSAVQYLRNRCQRLFIPLVFGTLVFLVPVQVWIERVSHGQFSGSFWQFYPLYFQGFYAFGGNFAWMGLHLWYLEVLFVFSLLTLPLFRYLHPLPRWIHGPAAWMDSGNRIFLIGLPVWIMELLVNLQPEGIGRRDFGGWSLATYLLVFVMGYLMARDDCFRNGLIRIRFRALGLGLLTLALILWVPPAILPDNGFGYGMVLLVRAFNSWFWMAAILGFGSRHLAFGHPFLGYARTAVLPFYILHQTAIVIMGFAMAQWQIPVAAKYLFLSGSALLAVLGVYLLLVRPLPIPGFLLGMPLKRPLASQALGHGPHPGSGNPNA